MSLYLFITSIITIVTTLNLTLTQTHFDVKDWVVENVYN